MKVFIAGCFAFSAGYMDAICLVRYRVFATIMTGNLLMAGLSLADPSFVKLPGESQVTQMRFCFCIIAAQMLGVALREHAEWLHPFGTIILCPFLILTFVAIEVSQYMTPYELYPQHFDVMFLAPIAGMMNSVCVHGVLGCPTTMATGHLQNLTYAMGDYLHEGKPLWNIKVGLHLTVSFFLLVGALVGGFLGKYSEGKRWQELLGTPVLLLAMVAIVLEDCHSTPQPEDEEAALVQPKRAGRWLRGLW